MIDECIKHKTMLSRRMKKLPPDSAAPYPYNQEVKYIRETFADRTTTNEIQDQLEHDEDADVQKLEDFKARFGSTLDSRQAASSGSPPPFPWRYRPSSSSTSLASEQARNLAGSGADPALWTMSGWYLLAISTYRLRMSSRDGSAGMGERPRRSLAWRGVIAVGGGEAPPPPPPSAMERRRERGEGRGVRDGSWMGKMGNVLPWILLSYNTSSSNSTVGPGG